MHFDQFCNSKSMGEQKNRIRQVILHKSRLFTSGCSRRFIEGVIFGQQYIYFYIVKSFFLHFCIEKIITFTGNFIFAESFK